MASLNKVILLGNLTRDPDLRYTPSGSAICEMGLAVSRKMVVNGNEQDEVCFVDIIVWAKQAETCKQYLSKGSSVLIEGRLQFDSWEDKNGGGRRSKLRVVAERVQFINTRRAENNNGDYNQGGNNYQQNSYNNQGNSQNSNYSNQNNYGNSNGNYNNSYNNAPSQGNYNNNQQNSYGNVAPSMPKMPEAAFNPNDDVDDDIPF